VRTASCSTTSGQYDPALSGRFGAEFPQFLPDQRSTGPVGNFSLIDIAEREWNYIDQLLEPIASEDTRRSPHADAFASYEKRRIAAAKTTIWGRVAPAGIWTQKGAVQLALDYSRFAEEMTKPKLEDFNYR